MLLQLAQRWRCRDFRLLVLELRLSSEDLLITGRCLLLLLVNQAHRLIVFLLWNVSIQQWGGSRSWLRSRTVAARNLLNLVGILDALLAFNQIN